MADFDFDSEQIQLRDSVRSFLYDRWGPRRVRESGEAFDRGLWSVLCELGLQTLLVPTPHAGAGLSLVDFVLVLEEFGRALVPAAMTETVLASEVIARHGSTEQQASWLPRIAAGERRLAFAHAEEGAGPGDGDISLEAGATGQGWRLRGSKILVPCAGAATHFVVSARTQGEPAGLYLCAADAAGLSHRPHRGVDPGACLGALHFDGVPAEPLGNAAAALTRLLETSSFAAAAQMVGVCSAALDIAVAYAKERVQFDRPVGAFQAVKHKCADMLVALEGARSAAYYAAWALSEDEPDAPAIVSMAKAACGDACRQCCNDALQVHGGVGFTWEFDIHLYLKRGKLLEYQFGDAAWHRERVAAAILD